VQNISKHKIIIFFPSDLLLPGFSVRRGIILRTMFSLVSEALKQLFVYIRFDNYFRVRLLRIFLFEAIGA
jgi:hypothetical protein